MFKKMHIMFILLMSIGLAGCFLQAENTPTLTPMETREQTVVPPLAAAIPTSTPSPTSTPAGIRTITQDCVRLASYELYPPVETENNFLLLSHWPAPRSPFLLNPANGKITEISSAGPPIYPSPDGHMFSYVSEGRINVINVANAKGETLTSIPLDSKEESSFFWGWLGDKHVMISLMIPAILPETPLDEILPPLEVINISDNSRIELKSVYPDIDWLNYLNWQHNRVIYDSSMNYAFYPSDNGNSLTLYSLPAQKTLVSLPAITIRTEPPQWSPNGEYLAVAGKVTESQGEQELFLLDKSGTATRLTHLTEQFDAVVWIGTLSWSPDNQKIAFWYGFDDSMEKRLAIVDLKTTAVKDFCVTYNASRYPPNTTWSPDSRMVLVNLLESEQDNFKVLWIDIETGDGAVMKTNATIEGWLVGP